MPSISWEVIEFFISFIFHRNDLPQLLQLHQSTIYC
nr:MAG TPA: hypothetical protein [Podoviridae sp. ctY3D12]